MTDFGRIQEICRRFAGLLAYPAAETAEHGAACEQLLRQHCPEAVAGLEKFRRFIGENDLRHVEEVFTATFELQALCHPYVGYLLCGESQQRTFFMIRLRQLYRQHGFPPGRELPDHLGEMLRFIGTAGDAACCGELIADALLPALDKLLGGVADEDHPYLALLGSLQVFLAGTSVSGSVDRPKECVS